MGLQPLENKALSWGIIRTSACILTEITIRKSQVISILHRGTVRSFKIAFRRFAAHPEEMFQFLGLTDVAKAAVLA